MKIKYLSKILCMLTAFVSLLTTVGVYATFNFSQTTPEDKSGIINVEMAEFKWQGSEVLPDEVQGEDHAWLIQNIVDGEGIGLNTADSYLNGLIEDRLDGGWGWKRDYFGSMAVTGGSQIDQIFGTKAAGLCFMVEAVSDTEYYIYTTSVYLGERGETNWLQTSNKTPGSPSIPLGEYIYAIYRTKITRPDTSSNWEIIETKEGKAISAWYEESRSNATITQIPSFTPSTWVETSTMGSEPTTENAIFTFKGDSRVMHSTSSDIPEYYRIKPTSAGTVQIYTYNLNATIKIYNNSNALISSSQKLTDANGTEYITVSFTASANTNYYISIYGDTKIEFTVV